MKLKIETLPNYRVAYKRRVGPYGPANIEVMEDVKKWASDRNLLKSAIIFAIPQDNPEATLPENCRFDVCIVVSKDYQIDDSIYEDELSGGKYAVYEIMHTAEDIQQAYNYIFTDLESRGYQIDDRPVREKYIGDMIDNPFCEICVPVKS